MHWAAPGEGGGGDGTFQLMGGGEEGLTHPPQGSSARTWVGREAAEGSHLGEEKGSSVLLKFGWLLPGKAA